MEADPDIVDAATAKPAGLRVLAPTARPAAAAAPRLAGRVPALALAAPVTPPLSARAAARVDSVRFCQTALAHAHDPERIAFGVEMNDPLRTLRPYQLRPAAICGCAHASDDARACIICAPSLKALSPFLAPCKELDAERAAVLAFVMDNRSVLSDAITWLSARRDWALSGEVSYYFNLTYPAVAEAMAEINALPAHALDGRAMAAWRESALSMDPLERPAYCNWLFLPAGRDAAGKDVPTRVFYVYTRVPNAGEIVDYLMVVLQPPKPLMDALTEAYSAAMESPRALAESRLKRRDSMHKKLPVVHARSASEGAVDGDARTARASRLDKFHALRQRFERAAPRIQLISADPRIQALQPRPDYLLARHKHYVNVFTVALPKRAPDVWPGEHTEASPVQQTYA